MPEAKKTTIRFTNEDLKNIERIKRSGLATNESEAVRVALAAVAYRLVNPTPEQRSAVEAVEKEIRRQLRS